MIKVRWVETARPNCLSARVEVMSRGFETGISEQHIDPIQQWCEENDCGQRLSFDTFRFRNRQEITMFLLRWG